MCRLFGFRSVILSQVHSSLLSAENALAGQSHKHPDGWGVAYYVHETPHLVKSASTAINDTLFTKVSGVVSSNTVLAHLRKATLGEMNILNTHPFQFGPWVFAHNGNIKDFENKKDLIMQEIPASLKRFILGRTDSEVIFFYILTAIEREIGLGLKNYKIDILTKVVQEAINDLIKIIGPYSKVDDAGETETYLSFILTNGTTMLAHHGGKNMFYSTYKNKCMDRDNCPSFSPECENATSSGFVNHLIFSSEPLNGDNIWIPLKLGQIIGVDKKMKIYFSC